MKKRMKWGKRVLALLIVLMMCVGMLPAKVFGDDIDEDSEIKEAEYRTGTVGKTVVATEDNKADADDDADTDNDIDTDTEEVKNQVEVKEAEVLER